LTRLTPNDTRWLRDAIVRGTVSSRFPWGVTVELDYGVRGFIDRDDLSDQHPVPESEWPSVGAEVEAVVFGVRGQKVALCRRPSYIDYVKATGSSEGYVTPKNRE